MSIKEIVNNDSLGGNDALKQLATHIPEFKDYKFGEKPIYTPKQFVKGLRTVLRYEEFGDKLNASIS